MTVAPVRRMGGQPKPASHQQHGSGRHLGGERRVRQTARPAMWIIPDRSGPRKGAADLALTGRALIKGTLEARRREQV